MHPWLVDSYEWRGVPASAQYYICPLRTFSGEMPPPYDQIHVAWAVRLRLALDLGPPAWLPNSGWRPHKVVINVKGSTGGGVAM